MTIPRRFLALICGLLVPASAAAVDITVSAGGSISSALSGASSGDRVLVEAGTYVETVNLVNGVALLGGYDASFSDATRNAFTNRTIINGNGLGPAVTSGVGIGAGTTVDGFTLTSGRGAIAGVLVQGGSPVFTNNEITQCRDGLAGGVYITGGSDATFQGNRIVNNSSAGSGGGVRVESSAPRLIDNLIADNTAMHQGGGLYLFDAAVYCSSNVIRGCRTWEASGGGAYLQQSPASARFAENRWESCRARTGGGVAVRDQSIAAFENETFVNCRAEEDGGGIALLTFSEATVMNCAFEDCSAGRSGGGIWALDVDLQVLGSGATVDPSPARFVRCTAAVHGGGLYAEETVGTVSRVRFTECEALDWGGGAYVLHSPFTITLNIVEGCSASEGGGMVLRTELISQHEVSTVLNNTLYGCRADGSGDPGAGFTLAAYGTVSIANFGGNILAFMLEGNAVRCRRGGSAAQTGTPFIQCSSFHVDPSNSTGVEVAGTRCDQAVNSSATNHIGLDPLFCDAPLGDYSLATTSPEAGTSCELAGGKLDRGAYDDGDYCPGAVSVEKTSWGQIKALYRQ